MIIGALAMAFCAAVLPQLIRQMGTVRASAAAAVVWLIAAAAVTIPLVT